MPAPLPGAKKDSTNEVPMIDLDEIARFITKIHDDGLETAAMPVVAKGCGYKHATSTPFYRRMVAARLFGLLTKTGAELTDRAKDYLKPDSQGADQRALFDAVMSIPAFAEKAQQLNGKKFNLGLVANGLEKSLNLTSACGMICAKAFEASLKFAGLLGADSLVLLGGSATKEAQHVHEEKTPITIREGTKNAPAEDEDQTTQTHTIYLDKTKQRKFVVTSPIDITSVELTRVNLFLEYALIVDQANPPPKEEVKI